MTATAKIENYIKALSNGLAVLPASESESIVAEIAAHLEHRDGEGKLDSAIASLGTPQDCAQRFREELALQSAFADGGPVRTMGALLSLSAKRSFAAIGLLFAGMFFLTSIAMAISVVVEIIAPQATGLWVGDNGASFFFGVIGEGVRAGHTEMLGLWYAPVALIISIATFLFSQWIGRLFLKQMLGRKRPLPA